MKRYLALNLPTFAVDHVRLRRRSSSLESARPLALLLLIDVIRGAQWIAQCCTGAAQCGVRSGMSLAHARALIGARETLVEHFDRPGSGEQLEHLSLWATRFSPHVCPDPPHGLLLDVSGSERLFDGEERLLEHVLAAFEARAFSARGCIANTIGCAWAGAHFGSDPRLRVPAGGEAEALGSLSTQALRLDPEVVDALAEVGVERIEQLFELPRETLPARFGSDLLLRLDQALGTAFEPLVPLRPRSFPCARRDFESPVGLEVVAYTLRVLLRELIVELEERGESARGVEFELHCCESENVFEEIVLSRARAGFEHIWSLIEPTLERVQLGFGVECIVLSMPWTVATTGQQGRMWGARSVAKGPDRALGELLDTLVGRLGRESLLGVEAVESHLPEHAFRTLPCSQAWETGGAIAWARMGASSADTRITTLPRPSRLFTPPERIEVEVGKGGSAVPVRFCWRGEVRVVVRRFGPERIAAPWWRATGTPGVRDYFCIQDQGGRWFWMVLDVNGSWFLHGEWL
ncbi:MAG: protein ImuB [Chlamydiales bacterium]